MKIELTKDIAIPFNNSFPSVVVQFEPHDSHYSHENMNYMPTYDEVLNIIKYLFIYEDMRYPKEKGYQGRQMLMNEILKVFNDPTVDVEIKQKGGKMAEEATRQTLRIEDMKGKEYISLKVGESAQFEIARIDKVKVDKDFALSGVDFRYEIWTSENKVLSVSAWKLWEVIRKAMEGQEKIEGVKLLVSHDGTKEYTAHVM